MDEQGGGFEDAELLSAATARDPYRCFARMRLHDPVHWHAPTRTWYVTSFAHVTRLLREPTLSASLDGHVGEQDERHLPLIRGVAEFFASWMVFSDPPHQSRLRKLVAPVFTRRAAESWRSFARHLFDEAARGVPDSGGDLLADYALPVSARLTCAVLGAPQRDDARLRQWSADLIGYLTTPIATVERARVAATAIEELRDYLCATILPALRASTAPPLQPLRVLADLPVEIALALFTQLLTGGVDPLASSLSTAAEVLLRQENAPLLAKAVDSPDVLDALVEEALRFDAPFHFVPRTTTETITIGDHVVPARNRVLLVIAAANRDPAVYPEPDAFRPGRPGPTHLSFGLGGHYCLGAALSRTVLREGVQALARHASSRSWRITDATRAEAFGATTWSRVLVG